MAQEFKLYYWPEIAGRGEFIRLLFAETQTPYVDVFEGKSFAEAMKMGYGKGKNFFAFPVVEHGDIHISQTPVICRYLGKKLDGGRLYPKTEQDRLQAEMIMAGLVDMVEDGKPRVANSHSSHSLSDPSSTVDVTSLRLGRAPQSFSFARPQAPGSNLPPPAKK